MSCDKCTSNAPNFPSSGETYTCKDCGARWILASVSPGAYWEEIETHLQQQKKANEIIKAIEE